MRKTPLINPNDRSGRRFRFGLAASFVLVLGAVGLLAAYVRADEQAIIEKRLADSVRYLASDKLEGRGLGSQGLELAAEYIAAQLTQQNLKTDLFAGTPYQKFRATTSSKLGPDNRLALVGPAPQNGKPRERIELKLAKDFNPMAMSDSGRFDLPPVFVGYGITGKKEHYDDYAGIDVKGKAVIILRHEPQQDDPKSVFSGTAVSAHAPLRRKASNAYAHGAAAVVFCTDEVEFQRDIAKNRKLLEEMRSRLAMERNKLDKLPDPDSDEAKTQRKRIDKLAGQVDALEAKLQAGFDPVLPFHAGGFGGPRQGLPVVHCRRGVLDRVVRSVLGTGLAELEHDIDKGPTPHSRLLDGWRLVGQIDVRRSEVEVKNVVATLEGEGPAADETLVIGAHYDHLGRGGPGSLARGTKAIHNGADDNASGVALLIEVARALAARPERLRRRVVFIAFTGEERGLFGSAHYVREPAFPLEKTIAMLNLDMVGRLRDDRLIVSGVGTAPEFGELLDRANAKHKFKLTKKRGGYGPSDHASFYAREIPVMHFFTGTHEDYHRPGDDFEKVNVPGMRRIASLVVEITVSLANAPKRPEYVAVTPPRLRPAGNRPFLGSIPDFGSMEPGYAMSGVVKGGPAERAGIRGGDVIVRFGESKIGGLEDIDAALRKYEAGDRVRVIVKRGGEKLTFEVTLDPPR